ncbi:ABC transporter ATP-binding protein [Nicoliella spurrieriana]|uniref:ABC transporter ATP-binding protein n=1 Tax=Nicoliella spurrieriana TaxID=2925830 RepID=A0A976RT31_9LACO|nr:ABC transporter ATP-binding protein [Nicoliella spurrieriana]UQS87355.1 ABC transporter ATP-binding protein [Nicoliella spurrieriana]
MTEQSGIQFDHVSFQYYSQAEPTLRDINLTINPGEKVLIVGPSGSGKSTLGNLINGIIPHNYRGDLTGTVTVDGINVATSSVFDLSLKVGTVLQNANDQFVGLTMAEDMAFGMENDATAVPEMHRRVAQWADYLNLTDHLAQSPQSLSGGQKQRVAMGDVLIDEGNIMLFDEPLAALDPATGYQTIQLIERLHREFEMTVVIIEHRLEEVLTQSVDRLIVLNDGQIVANGHPDAILKSDIMPQLGLREPLYVEALKAANVDLETVQDIADVERVNAPQLATQLATLTTQEQPAGSTSASPLLTIADLSFGYPDQAPLFKDLNLTVNRGDHLALVGRNGIGKSTLSKLITGFLTPTAGRISLNGQPLANDSIKERADHIGYVMQDPDKMISQVTIKDEVGLGLKLRGVTGTEMTSRVNAILKVCGLYPYRNWPISALSFGQKKRVTIASILVLKPEVLILDEPTAGQDFRHYTEMMNFLTALNHQGTTLITITHDMHLMLEYANRAVVLGEREVLADTKPVEVLSDANLCQFSDLRPTSLYQLAKRFDLNPETFTNRVIEYELGATKHE